jgi:hypothetical protein
MTQTNAYNTLTQTGLGSPLLGSSATVNVWQHVESFDRLAVAQGAPASPAFNVNYAFTQDGGGSSINFAEDNRGGEQLFVGSVNSFAYLRPHPLIPNLLFAMDWSPEFETIYDAAVDTSVTNPTNTLAVQGGWFTSPVRTGGLNSLRLEVQPTLHGPNWQVIRRTADVDEIFDTGVPFAAGVSYRLTILSDADRTARCFIDGAKVATLAFPPGPLALQPMTGGARLAGGSGGVRIFVRGVRVARKFRP